MTKPLTWVEIDLKAIKYNVGEVKKCMKRNRFYITTRGKKRTIPTEIMAIVKADAYGHGLLRVTKLLDREGVGKFCVSDISDGILLRKRGIKKPILLIESTLPSFANEVVQYKLMATICTFVLANKLNTIAKKKKIQVDVHVKVDTGMGRLGIWHEEAYDFICKISQLTSLRIMGIFTHFPAADTDRNFTMKQINSLYQLVLKLDRKGVIIPFIHAANSMGLAGYKTHILNLARPGLMLYGHYPHYSLKNKVNLKPAMSVKSKIIFLKDVNKGRSISYGRTFLTKRKMKLATIPIGYNDGYFRGLSNKASVLIDGIRCSLVGRVTMDQIVVDASRVKKPQLGMLVTIVGQDKKEEITMDELANLTDTINYEMVCSLGNRLPRKYT